MKRVLVYGMTDNNGGIESYLINVYRHLEKDKITFDFVTDFSEIAYRDELLAGGSRIFKIPAKGRHPIGHITALAKVLKTHPEYDVVYYNILNAGGAYSMLAARTHHRKVVVHAHNNSDDNIKLHKAFKPLLNSLADVKLACSRQAAAFMYRNPEDAIVIRNGIEASKYAFDAGARESFRTELGIADKYVVITVGRMAPQKNPIFILDVMSEIIKRRENAVLLYVGCGPLEEEVRHHAALLKIQDKVLFMGMRNDVNRLINAADCFLFPSKYEGFGIALLEAQVNGLRCYTSEGVVPKETNVNGLVTFLSLSLSAEEWARTIIKADTDKLDRESYAKSLAGSGYEIEDTAKALMNLLETKALTEM